MPRAPAFLYLYKVLSPVEIQMRLVATINVKNVNCFLITYPHKDSKEFTEHKGKMAILVWGLTAGSELVLTGPPLAIRTQIQVKPGSAVFLESAEQGPPLSIPGMTYCNADSSFSDREAPPGITNCSVPTA